MAPLSERFAEPVQYAAEDGVEGPLHRFLEQEAPAGFSAVAGAVVPNSVTTAPITSKAASDVPALKPYHFAMLQHKLVIVNPANKKIAEVITR